MHTLQPALTEETNIDEQTRVAIEKSLRPGESSGHDPNYEIPIEERHRKESHPVAL